MIASLTPFLVLMFWMMFVSGDNIDIKHSFLRTNDECAWWHQVAAFKEYGAPLGYYGYNGNHAEIGTFGAWGVFILVPYALFACLFGWNYNSMVIANLFFLCLANLIFMFLTQIKVKNVKWLVICNFVSFLTIGYSAMSMSEPLRYSMAIILSGVFYRLYYIDTGKIFKYIAVPLVLLFMANAYLVFIIFIPLYFFAVLKDKHLWLKLSLSALFTFILTFAIWKFTSLISAPYFVSKLRTILDTITEDLWKGIQFLFATFFNSLRSIDIFTVISSNSAYNGTIEWFELMYYIMAAVIAIFFFQKRKKDNSNEKTALFISAYILISFFIIFITFYDTIPLSLTRGLNVALIAAVFFLYNIDFKKPVIIFLCITSLGVSTFWGNFSFDLQTRAKSDEWLANYETLKTELSEYIVLDYKADPYQNTVALYGGKDLFLPESEYMFWMAMPVGIGLNLILDGSVDTSIRYAVVLNTDNYADTVSNLINSGYVEIYSNGNNKIFIV